MANVKITALTANTTPLGTDIVPMVDDPGGTPLSQKITITNLSKAVTPEGTNILSTGEAGGTKFLREDGLGGASWQSVPGGGDALTANPLSQFAATTSLQLKGVISDETGSGALVFADTPTLVTPTLGVASATSVNKVAITAPATGATLTIPDGVTLTGPAASGTVMTLGNAETVSGAKRFTATIVANEIDAPAVTGGADPNDLYLVGGTGASARNGGGVFIYGNTALDGNQNGGDVVIGAGGKSGSGTDGIVAVEDFNTTFQARLDTTALAANRTFTFPDATGTLALTSNLSSYQPLDPDLTTIAGLTATTNNFIASVSSAWASITPTSATALLNNVVGDSGLGGTKGLVPAPAAGDAAAGKFLKADGTWTAVAAGGQSTYDAIVASSGGDYTTLGAAITAASNGWSIFVKEGTYTESTITTSLTNLTIVGENPKTTILDGSTNTLTFSGTGVQFRNIGATFTTGGFVFSGTYHMAQNCEFIGTGIGTVYSNTGATSRMTNCSIQNTLAAVGNNTVPLIKLNGASSVYTNSYFIVNSYNASVANAGIVFNGANQSVFSNCVVKSNVNGTTGYLFATNGSCEISNVHFVGKSTETTIAVTGGYGSITNCYTGSCAVFINFTSASNNMSIIGCYANPGTTGISINGNGNKVVGCTLGDASGAGGGTMISIAASSSQNTISGNFLDSSGTTVSLASSTASRGNSIVGNSFGNTSTTPISDGAVGTEIGAQSGLPSIYQKHFDYMKNTSGGSLAAGDVVTLKAVAAGNEVTTTTTASDNLVWGMAQEAITNNSYGYIQRTGKTTQLKANGSTAISVGDFLMTKGTTAKISAKAATTGNLAFAIALEAYSTADDNGVLDALLITPINKQ